MIKVKTDAQLADATLMVANAVRDDLRRVQVSDLAGTVYLGLGSTDLIGGGDSRPHVAVPLTRDRWLDAVARAQLFHADGVVAMDEAEAAMLAPLVAPRSMLVFVNRTSADDARGVIRTSNPFDAAEVQAFRSNCPAVAIELDRLGVVLEPFSPRPITVAVLEAMVVASPAGADDRPRSPRIDSAR